MTYFTDRFFRLMGKSVGPTFLLIGILAGGACTPGGESSSNNDPTPNTQKALAEQRAKTEAAKKAAEEAKQKAEAARQAGNAAKAAEEEKKRKEAEAEAEKQQQIQNALQSAEPALVRARQAKVRVALRAKNSLKDTGLPQAVPFTEWVREATAAYDQAWAAFQAIQNAQEATLAFDKAEEVSLSANRGEATARKAEAFVSGFQSRFTLNSADKRIIPQTISDPNQTKPQCESALRELFQGLTAPSVSIIPSCVINAAGTMEHTARATYNCHCSYHLTGGKMFYMKQ